MNRFDFARAFLTLTFSFVNLSIRPLAAGDLARFINYWQGLSPIEMERMGVAVERMPSANQMRENLEPMLSLPDNNTHSSVLAWCLDGEAVGHSSLKDIVPGESGNIHLHLWRTDLRGKGYGPRLFCLAALDFYDRFQLKRMLCEPKADNPAPNRLLQKIGFPLISTRTGASSELSATCLLHRYDIQRRIAEEYLRVERLTS